MNDTLRQALALNHFTAVAWLRLLFVMALAIAMALTPGFLSAPSLLTLLTTFSFVGCIAVGMTFITLSGNIMSFSLGATVAVCAVTFVTVLNGAGVITGMAAALAVGALVSAAQGVIIGGLRANPIIVSIAALALINGSLNLITGNATINAMPGAGHEILRGKLFGLPIEFVALLILVCLGQLILSYTTFGRHIYYVGSGARAAETVGLRVGWIVTGAYFWAGLFSAVAGILLGLRYNQANMEFGTGYDYDAIAAILVGGTAIQGGHGSIIRTFAGAIFIATIQVLLLLHGFRQEWQYLFAGIIVLLVVMLQTTGRRRA